MFIVSLIYKVPLETIDQHLQPHVEFLKRQYEAGHFIASGRKVPRTGGIILVNVESKEKLNNILAEDPFHQNNLADYEITEFIPTKTSERLKFLLE